MLLGGFSWFFMFSFHGILVVLHGFEGRFRALFAQDQIYDIFKCLPPDVQVCLFSATMAPEILDMTTKFMRNAVPVALNGCRL